MKLQTLLFAVLAILLLIDWRQTLVIFTSNGRWGELNPVLRWLFRRFGLPGVHAWFALACIVIGAALYFIAPWRVEVAVVFGAAELACVILNFRHGIRP
jgi:membrane protein implicated in regulation of membrane protease activity